MKKKKKGLPGALKQLRCNEPQPRKGTTEPFAGPDNGGNRQHRKERTRHLRSLQRGLSERRGPQAKTPTPQSLPHRQEGFHPFQPNTHFPKPRGDNFWTHCGRKAPAVLRYTPPRQVPGVPEWHLGIPGCPESARPSICPVPSPATLPPKTRPKATARPLACVLLPPLLHTSTGLLTQRYCC
jgi:hypothetical protein